MTTPENVGKAYMLSEVEKQIRKDIPRLMELREGCLVRKDNEVFRIEENPKGDGYYVGRYFYLYEESIAERYEIIGHDIMLNDVLEWLAKYDFYCITSNGNLMKPVDGGKCYYEFEFTEIKINLSYPYLKDQSEELIKFLYNFIKE